jgi:hypothetical protein
VDNWKNITNSESFGGTFSFSNCHIIGLDNGSLVLIVFDCAQKGPQEIYEIFSLARSFHSNKNWNSSSSRRGQSAPYIVETPWPWHCSILKIL